MDIIQEFDTVLLADGRQGAVVEVLGEQDIFLVDVGSSPEDWKTLEVKREQIKEIL